MRGGLAGEIDGVEPPLLPPPALDLLFLPILAAVCTSRVEQGQAPTRPLQMTHDGRVAHRRSLLVPGTVLVCLFRAPSLVTKNGFLIVGLRSKQQRRRFLRVRGLDNARIGVPLWAFTWRASTRK